MKNKDNIIIIDKLDKKLEFNVKDNENKTFLILHDNGQSSEGNVNIVISGKNANVQILGIILGFGLQTINLYTLQDHLKANSVSDLFIKSVLFDKAKFYYKGLIKIEKDAQKSNAYQKNQNLLLSNKSWADSRPSLEILANDVRCTHGATVGKLDENQLYYLETRGLNKIEASRMLINGFFTDVIGRIPDQKIKDKLMSRVEEKIEILMKGVN